MVGRNNERVKTANRERLVGILNEFNYMIDGELAGPEITGVQPAILYEDPMTEKIKVARGDVKDIIKGRPHHEIAQKNGVPETSAAAGFVALTRAGAILYPDPDQVEQTAYFFTGGIDRVRADNHSDFLAVRFGGIIGHDGRLLGAAGLIRQAVLVNNMGINNGLDTETTALAYATCIGNLKEGVLVSAREIVQQYAAMRQVA